jgi:hypothetical protein
MNRQMTKVGRTVLKASFAISKREIAIEIYQLFETSSDERARENFDLYDENPHNLPKEFRWLVKRSYAAAATAMEECAKVCDECNVQDDNNNGAAATGAAGAAAETIRKLAAAPHPS